MIAIPTAGELSFHGDLAVCDDAACLYRISVSFPPASSSPASRPQRACRQSGPGWLHEIKHDGFRVIARKNGDRVRLYSRPGNDLTDRFPLIVETLARLRSRSVIVDGEAVVVRTARSGMAQ